MHLTVSPRSFPKSCPLLRVALDVVSMRRSRSRSNTPLQRSLEEEEEDNTENLNPEERYNSELRRTTAQIHGLNLDSGRGMSFEERREVAPAALSMLPPLGGGTHRQRLAPQNWEEERLAPLQRLVSSREASPVKRMGSWEYVRGPSFVPSLRVGSALAWSFVVSLRNQLWSLRLGELCRGPFAARKSVACLCSVMRGRPAKQLGAS